jgi:glycerophosphoryl diester phosphodiesterase
VSGHHSPTPLSEPRCRRVGHSIIKAGADLSELAERLAGATWDMVELDVLASGDELVIAHSAEDLDHPRPVRFADALIALREALPESVELDVDLKGTGYEHAALATLRSLGLVDRTLVSTMEPSSLQVLRAQAPELRLGLSVPRARRDYLSHPLTRPAAYAMLAYLRRVMPRRAARAVSSGLADAIMAHWGVVTPALVRAVRDAGGDLYVWTVDDAERLRALHALGVSAVITNDGELFARAGVAPT